MKTTEELWTNCSNKKLLKELDVCPEIIEELEKHSTTSTTDLVVLYDLILTEYNMRWCIDQINKGKRSGFTYNYRYKIDDEWFDISPCEFFKTRAEAQLRAVHETMYKLRDRIINSQTLR